MRGLLSRKPAPTMLRAVVLLVIGAVAIQYVAGQQGRSPGSITEEFPRTDFSRAIISADEIISGGPPRDGIPALDDPVFISAARARWLDDLEPVIVVTVGSESRAYPLQIMIWHEIVNDEVNGKPLAITFCPLCNATLVFERDFDGQVLDFGTTGRLRMSDLLMYDRQTESWWQQFTGEGLIGHYAGRTLTEYPAAIVAFADFRSAHPAGKVLSRRTGYNRRYGENPYRGYDRIDQSPFMFDGDLDPRLRPMERILAVRVGDHARVYPFSRFEAGQVLNDEVEATSVAIFAANEAFSALDHQRIARSRRVPSLNAFDRRLDGRVLSFEARDDAIFDAETGSRWTPLGQAVEGPLSGKQLAGVAGGVHFAFAWLAFRPDSSIHGQE